MKNIIYRFCILFLAIASVSCKKDPPEEPEAFDFKVADGMIQSPQWLVDQVEKVADRYDLTYSGKKYYPWVYLYKYNGQGYVYVMDGLSTPDVDGDLFFTLSGEPVVGLSDFRGELYEAIGLDDLFWRYEYRSEKE